MKKPDSRFRPWALLLVLVLVAAAVAFSTTTRASGLLTTASRLVRSQVDVRTQGQSRPSGTSTASGTEDLFKGEGARA